MNYFDFNATHPLLPAALEAWTEAARLYWANPSSASQPASAARLHLSACRRTWAESFAARPENVVFTAGATEANNAVLRWVALQCAAEARLLLSPFEHPAVLEPAQALFPGRVDLMALDESGAIDLTAVDRQLSTQAYALLALMAANNETGLIQPVTALAQRCQEHGLPILCDAAQWIGKLPPHQLPPVDYLTFSGHKFGGPRGTGAIILSDAVQGFRGRLGGQQEHGHHAGTETVEGIAALTAAFKAQPPAGWSSAGRDAFLKTFKAGAYRLIGEGQSRLPNTVALVLPRHRSTRWLPRLEKRGYIVSSGAACATGKEGPSHVMQALGLSAEEAARVIRLSGGPETTEDAWLGLRGALDAVLDELDRDQAANNLVTVVDPDAL